MATLLIEQVQAEPYELLNSFSVQNSHAKISEVFMMFTGSELAINIFKS